MKKTKIRNTFIYLNFKRWLKKNHHRFNVRPYIYKVKSRSFFIRLQGISTMEFEFSMKGGINVWIIKENIENVKTGGYPDNLLTDFIIFETKNNNGYYCSFCETPVYFCSRNDLWVDQIYEPLLSWVNEKFTPDNYLCIYADDGEFNWSGSKILSSIHINEDVMLNHRIYCKPLVEREN